MNPSTSWGGIALIVAVGAASTSTGCSSVLGLGDFTEAEDGATTGTGSTTSTGDATTTTTSTDATTTTGPGGGGDGGSSAETSSSSTGGGGGGTGGAGGGGVLSCTAGAPIEVFSPLDLGGAALDDERLAVLSRPGSNRVHVGVVLDHGQGSFQIAARTIQLGAVPDLRQIVLYPEAPDGQHRRFIGAYATPASIRFWGIDDRRLGEFVFPGDDGVQGPVTFHEYPAPAECLNFESFAAHQDESGVARFAATCTDANLRAHLYGGTRDTLEFVVGPADPVGEPPLPPVDMRVRSYGRAGGRHWVFTGPDGLVGNEGGFLRMGSTSQDLATARPLVPPADQGMLVATGPEIQGRLFVGALHANPAGLEPGGELDGAYRTGAIAPADAQAFAADVTSVLPGSIAFDDLSSTAPFFVLQRSGGLVLSAGATLVPGGLPNDVLFSAWQLDGQVAVDRFPVVTSVPELAYLAAGAASAGFGTVAVVWSEVGGGTFRVRASGVACE